MNQQVKDKLKQLPKTPGVYLHKDNSGEVIYVGKAANLNSRVRSYFQKSNIRDVKTQALVDDIADIDWLETGSEVDALFLESEMIKRYQPKFNILLRDDKQFLYIKFSKDEYPRVTFTRRPLDDGAEYFGPYTSSFGLRKAMRQLRRSFPYVTHRTLPKRGCLHYHIGLCPGPEVGATIPAQYRKNLNQIKRYLRGKSGAVMRDLKKQMRRQAKNREYEAAAKTRDQLNNLKSLSRQHIFGDREMFDLTRDQAVHELKELLGLDKVPRRLECYDVSHIQGTNNAASMVVFMDGVPARGEYRKFKMRQPGNDDFAHMHETLSRRLKYWDRWPKPDAIIIDGGKGQVKAAIKALGEKDLSVPVIGLAKRHEEIVMPLRDDNDMENKSSGKGFVTSQTNDFQTVALEENSHLIKLLQHIRDEAHRFAVTYHSQLRGKQQTSSVIESIPGVGPATRKKLIRHFGSLNNVKAASRQELEALVGPKTAQIIAEYLQ